MKRVARYVALIAAGGGVALTALTMARAGGVKRASAGSGTPTTPSETDVPVTVKAEGRIVSCPGATVDVRSEIAGRIVSLPIQEQQRVRRGDVVAEIAADELRAALAEARAQRAEADADTTWLSAELQRATRLVRSGSVSKQTLDRTMHDLTAARSRRAMAEATVQRLNATLAKTRLVAPIDGTIVSRPAVVGEVIVPGAQLATIADLNRRRVEAEVDEYDAGRVRLGAPVSITAEGYGTQTWRGTVEAIPSLVVPRRLSPLDPGRPSDMQVLLVKVALPPGAPLKLGQRVELTIDAR